MQKEKVNIAQGYPETRERLRAFLAASNLKYSCRLKTLADAIDFSIEQAQKVPELENEISKLEQGIIELSYECGDLKIENEKQKKKIGELEKNAEGL